METPTAAKDVNVSTDLKAPVIALFNSLGVQCTKIDIRKVYRLGKEQNKPICVALYSLYKKDLIMACKAEKLKNTQISIGEDIPKEIRQKLGKQREAKKDAKKRTALALSSESSPDTPAVTKPPGNPRHVHKKQVLTNPLKISGTDQGKEI